VKCKKFANAAIREYFWTQKFLTLKYLYSTKPLGIVVILPNDNISS